jgi:hypothetical protein
MHTCYLPRQFNELKTGPLWLAGNVKVPLNCRCWVSRPAKRNISLVPGEAHAIKTTTDNAIRTQVIDRHLSASVFDQERSIDQNGPVLPIS